MHYILEENMLGKNKGKKKQVVVIMMKIFVTDHQKFWRISHAINHLYLLPYCSF